MINFPCFAHERQMAKLLLISPAIKMLQPLQMPAHTEQIYDSSVTFFYKEEVFPNIQIDHFLMKANLITVSLSTKSLENTLYSLFFLYTSICLNSIILTQIFSVLSYPDPVFFNISQRPPFLEILLPSPMPFSKCKNHSNVAWQERSERNRNLWAALLIIPPRHDVHSCTTPLPFV